MRFLKDLLKPNSGVSSRRLIALSILPLFAFGILVGLTPLQKNISYDFFVVSIIASGVPFLIAYDFFTPSQIIASIKAMFIKIKNNNYEKEQ